MACRFYVATVLIETTIDLAIEGELFLRVQDERDASGNQSANNQAAARMPVYLSVFALAQ